MRVVFGLSAVAIGITLVARVGFAEPAALEQATGTAAVAVSARDEVDLIYPLLIQRGAEATLRPDRF